MLRVSGTEKRERERERERGRERERDRERETEREMLPGGFQADMMILLSFGLVLIVWIT